MGKVKILDISGIPFVVEKREDGMYIIGIRMRKRVFKFETSAIPAEVLDKLIGESGDGKIDGIDEIEKFLEGMDEDEKLSDKVPDGFVTDEEMNGEWERILQQAKDAANKPSGE